MLSGVAAQVLQRIFLKLGRFLCQNRFSVMKKLTLVWKGVLWLVSLLEDCVQLLCSRLGSQVRCTRIYILGGRLFLKANRVNNNQHQKATLPLLKDGLGLLFRQRWRKHSAEGRNSLPKVCWHKNTSSYFATCLYCVMIVMIFASTRYYYLAMAEDIFLRLLWVIGLILKQVC